MQRKKRNLLTLGAIGCAVLLFAGLGIVQTLRSHNAIAIAQDIPDAQKGLPSIGGAFELVSANGKTWKDKDFKGKPMLVYFGYSYCPHICPQALSHMTEAIEELGGARVVQPIFITLDPERDTPANLESYAQNFHKDFVMLRGSKDQVDKALKAYRVYAAKAAPWQDEEINHSSLIYFMDKNGNYLAHFNHQTPASDMVTRVRDYLEQGE